jgi:hypothetical protein
MKNYHIIIKTERRTESERMAIPMRKMLPNGTDAQGKPVMTQGPEQLHSMGEFPKDLADPQFVMVAEWDDVSPFVVQHKGIYADVAMRYMGWPEIEEKDYVPPADPV